MNSIGDDQLNELTIDIPSVQAVFYRYISSSQSGIQVHLVIGYSQLEVVASYPGVPDSTDKFEGLSYGIGLEEAFHSVPNLKFKLDWVTLYNGDQVEITATSLGLRYEF